MSSIFDDIYFSVVNGRAETDWVFIDGNDLRRRFASGDVRTIAETGFGFGLNCLCALKAWRDVGPDGTRLRYIAFERDLPAPGDAVRALAPFDELSPLRETLLARWPAGGAGVRIADFGNMRLELHLGDVRETLPRAAFQADAWFLDGFSPARNPDMWSDELFREVARLSAAGASAATFTAAGFVRRALAAHGFSVTRERGFAGKRHMTQARDFRPAATGAMRWSWASPHAVSTPPRRIAVIGGGVAGACAARTLSERGATVTVFDDPDKPGPSRSNPVGLVGPKLDVGDDPIARFHAAAFAYAARLYETHDLFLSRGLFRPDGDQAQAARADAAIVAPALAPAELARREGGMWMATAGAVRPAAIVEAFLREADVRRTEAPPLDDLIRNFDAVVVAAGASAADVAPLCAVDQSASRGQITLAAAKDHGLGHAVANGAYVAAADRDRVAFGATYRDVPLETVPISEAGDDEANFRALNRLAPDIAAKVDRTDMVGVAGLRAVTADRTPLAGPAPDMTAMTDFAGAVRRSKPEAIPRPPVVDKTFLLTGLGSRGLTTAPYAAEILAAHLFGESPPTEGDVTAALHPARFAVRAAKRGKL